MSMHPNTRGTASRSDSKDVRVATHVPAVKLACEIVKPTHIIEHGMGNSSTPLFHGMRGVEHILSFENQERWRVCNKCTTGNGHPKHTIAPYSETGFSELTNGFPADRCVALIDGDNPERPKALEQAMKLGVPWIVEHDAECMSGGELEVRLRLCIALGYSAHQYVAQNPESIVYVKGNTRPEALSEKDYAAIWPRPKHA